MTRLMLLGDVHGNTPHLEKAAKMAKRHKVDLIFQLGDFGFVWQTSRIPNVNNVLKQFGVPLVWLDGNHENFDMLAKLGATPQDDKPTKMDEFVTYSPRGYVWDFDGVRVMTLGGAFSVDVGSRVHGRSWWPEETITNADVDRACAQGKVDILLAHDAPELPPRLSHMMETGGGINLRTMEREGYKLDRASRSNRIAVTAVMQEVEPKLLVHGHMHFRYNDTLANTTVVGLDRDTTGNKSWVIIETDKLDEHLAEIGDAGSALGR